MFLLMSVHSGVGVSEHAPGQGVWVSGGVCWEGVCGCLLRGVHPLGASSSRRPLNRAVPSYSNAFLIQVNLYIKTHLLKTAFGTAYRDAWLCALCLPLCSNKFRPTHAWLPKHAVVRCFVGHVESVK